MHVYNPTFYMMVNPLDAFNPVKQVQLLISGDPQMIQAAIVSQYSYKNVLKRYYEYLNQGYEEEEAMFYAESEEQWAAGIDDIRNKDFEESVLQRRDLLVELAKGFPGVDELAQVDPYDQAWFDWEVRRETGFGSRKIDPLTQETAEQRYLVFKMRLANELLDQGLINVPEG